MLEGEWISTIIPVYSPSEVDKVWDMWGFFCDLENSIFYLLERGDDPLNNPYLCLGCLFDLHPGLKAYC